MALPTVKKEYMSDGNNPKAVKGGKFPVLGLSDGGRYVGRPGQSFADLKKEAKKRGMIA